MANTLLWVLFIVSSIISYIAWRFRDETKTHEPFVTMIGGMGGVSLSNLTTQALDAAPTTSEAKNHYKNLLLFADDDIRKQGTQGLRILADFRDRVYGPRDFRDDLTIDNFKENWPEFLAPLDTTIQEPIPDSATAVTAESQLLAYLQKNFPQEQNVDEQTGSFIRQLTEDFGHRFVFKNKADFKLRDDFLRQPLLKGWSNPAAKA